MRAHISSTFDCIPFTYYDEQDDQVIRPDFLQFYEGMGLELFCMCALWSDDPTGGKLHLRPTGEYTHFFSTDSRRRSQPTITTQAPTRSTTASISSLPNASCG